MHDFSHETFCFMCLQRVSGQREQEQSRSLRSDLQVQRQGLSRANSTRKYLSLIDNKRQVEFDRFVIEHFTAEKFL